MSERPRVMVVDDDDAVCRLVVDAAREAGFDAEAAATGQAAMNLAARFKPAVVVLDLMLPDIPGTEVCRRLRGDASLAEVGVLILSARADEYDRVLGFEVGADDYVVKPFSIRELVLRVRALARRVSARQASGTGRRLRWRGIELDAAAHRVHVDGADLTLRPLEYRLLRLFLENPGSVLPRERLLREVWGITGEVNTRTVDTHVRRLRERLTPYDACIQTVHGFGYRLRDA